MTKSKKHLTINFLKISALFKLLMLDIAVTFEGALISSFTF